MILLKTHIIPAGTEPVRLLDYVLEIFPEMTTRSSTKKALKKGVVLVDGEQRPSGWWVKPEMKLELFDPELKPPKILPMKLEIIFEDDQMAVVKKPAGISVSGNKYVTIQNALMYNLQASTSVETMAWPKPVHRLDFPTSGLLLVAKTKQSVVALSRQFENKTIKKR
ncbi:MAG: RluA family pseudouridine synthase, partial [Bacteroidetes bacterium]